MQPDVPPDARVVGDAAGSSLAGRPPLRSPRSRENEAAAPSGERTEKTICRLDARPVGSPRQKGELAERASSGPSWGRSPLTTLIAFSGSSTATWTCIPKISSRRAMYCIWSISARYRSFAVMRWRSKRLNGCVPGRSDPQTLAVRDLGHVPAELHQLPAHVRDRPAHGCRDLDHRLHELGVDALFELVTRYGVEHRLDVLHEVERSPVEQLVLLFDAERVRVALSEDVVEDASFVHRSLAGDRRWESLLPAHDSTASTSISTFHAGSSRARDHRRVRRADIAEDLAVRAADTLEVGGVGDVHARAHDVLERRARVLERLPDDLEAEARLLVRVVGRRGAVGWNRRRAGDEDLVPDDDRARVTPRSPRRASARRSVRRSMRGLVSRRVQALRQIEAGRSRSPRREWSPATADGDLGRCEPCRSPCVRLEARRSACPSRRRRGGSRRSRRDGRPARLDRAASARAHLGSAVRGRGADRATGAAADLLERRVSRARRPPRGCAPRCRSRTTCALRSVEPLGIALDPAGDPGSGMHASLGDVLAMRASCSSPRSSPGDARRDDCRAVSRALRRAARTTAGSTRWTGVSACSSTRARRRGWGRGRRPGRSATSAARGRSCGSTRTFGSPAPRLTDREFDEWAKEAGRGLRRRLRSIAV